MQKLIPCKLGFSKYVLCDICNFTKICIQIHFTYSLFHLHFLDCLCALYYRLKQNNKRKISIIFNYIKFKIMTIKAFSLYIHNVVRWSPEWWKLRVSEHLPPSQVPACAPTRATGQQSHHLPYTHMWYVRLCRRVNKCGTIIVVRKIMSSCK